jgi:hypothetical protein
MDVTAIAPGKRKRKLTALPLLIVLFVVSYCLLSRLVVEQDKTIDSQRDLIHLLFQDNVSLSKLHKHSATLPKKPLARGNIEIEFPGAATATSSKSTPSNQVQSAQVPPINVEPQTKTRPDPKAGRAKRTLPVKPPVQLTDPSDMRRVTHSI